MRYDGVREGEGERPTVFLVEEHPDHAVVLSEILEERGFRVELHRARDVIGAPLPGPVLLSTATDPDAAARLLARLRSRPSRPPVFVLDGPGRRWDPASAAGGGVVAGVLSKETGTAFCERLGNLLAAWRERPPGTGTDGRPRLPHADPCAAAVVRIRLARLVRLLGRLAPLAHLGGPAAAPLAEVLARADDLARRAARAAGRPPPGATAAFRPADLVLVRRRAWEILAGVPVGVAPGPVPTSVAGNPARIARLLDGLVLGAALVARERAGAVQVSLQPPGPDETSRGVAVRIAPGEGIEAGSTCGELAEELGLPFVVEAGTAIVTLPGARSSDAGAAAAPRTVLVASPPGGPGDQVAAFARERGGRVTRAMSAAEVRDLLSAGCLFDVAFLGLPGEAILEELAAASPRTVTIGLGEASADDVAALLEGDGLGWLAAPPSSEDLASAWRLAAALA